MSSRSCIRTGISVVQTRVRELRTNSLKHDFELCTTPPPDPTSSLPDFYPKFPLSASACTWMHHSFQTNHSPKWLGLSPSLFWWDVIFSLLIVHNFVRLSGHLSPATCIVLIWAPVLFPLQNKSFLRQCLCLTHGYPPWSTRPCAFLISGTQRQMQ